MGLRTGRAQLSQTSSAALAGADLDGVSRNVAKFGTQHDMPCHGLQRPPRRHVREKPTCLRQTSEIPPAQMRTHTTDRCTFLPDLTQAQAADLQRDKMLAKQCCQHLVRIFSEPEPKSVATYCSKPVTALVEA